MLIGEIVVVTSENEVLESVTANSPSQVHVLLHHSHSVGVEATQVGILEQAHHVGLGCLLERHQSLTLEPKVVVDA